MAAAVPASPPCVAASAANAPQAGLSIIAEPTRSTYTAGDPVKVDVLIRNSGGSDASIGWSAFDLSSFRFVVLGPSSEPVAQTEFAKKLLAIPRKVKKNTPLTVGAGWQRRYEFDLGRMFDLSAPGMYSVTVKRVVVVAGSTTHSAAQVELLTSDPVAISIAAPQAQTAATPAPAPQSKPAKAVSRSTIAFVREGDIWLANGEGNEQRLVIHNGEAPSWSPDKSLIAFARDGNVWIADPDGQDQRELTTASSLEAGVNPVFSPDGRWIAYRSWNQRVGIMVREVSIDGKIDKELIPDAEEPSW